MKVYKATTSFVADGVSVTRGDTVTEGHPLMRGRESLFVPFRPTFTYKPQPAEVTRRSATPRPRTPHTTPRTTRRA